MSTKELEEALERLVELGKKGHRPSHLVARHVLLSLAEALRTAEPGGAADMVERARSAGRSAGPGWPEAVEVELAMACGEFAQCLDPRFLSLPDYDLGYTQAARARLADRLQAAQALGFELPPREAEVLELADRVLASFAAERAGRQEGAPPPSSPAKDPPPGAKRSSRNRRHN